MDPTKLPGIGLSKSPALFPPEGVESNFVNPYSIGPILTRLSAIFLALMSLCVLIRFYTKIFIKHSWGWDDWLCIPAVIGTVGFAAVSIAICQTFGSHKWNVPVSAFTPAIIRCQLVVDVIYSPTILMAKLSLLFLYLDVFRSNARLRCFIYFGIAFNILFYTSVMVAFFIIYMPRKGEMLFNLLYKPRIRIGVTLAIVQGAVNVGSDLYILCLPIPGVWQLQAPLSKKIGISVIFLTGILACVSSVVGLWYRTRIDAWGDVIHTLVPVLIWVVIELTVGVICGCLPTFPGFFRHHLPLLRSLVSRVSWKVKEISFRKPSSKQIGSSSSGRSKRILQTKDIRVTFGTQIDNDGHFLNPQSVFAREENWSQWEKLTDDTPGPNCTRRAWHEQQIPEKPQRSHIIRNP